MADEQTKAPPSGAVTEADQKNGHNGQAKFPPGQQDAQRLEGHDGAKYAPPKKDDAGGQGQGGDDKKPASPLRRLVIWAIVAAVAIIALRLPAERFKQCRTNKSELSSIPSRCPCAC